MHINFQRLAFLYTFVYYNDHMQPNRNNFFEKCSLFASFLNIFLAIFYIASRIPIKTDYLLAVRIIGLSQVIIFFYIPLRFILKRSPTIKISFIFCLFFIFILFVTNNIYKTGLIYLLAFFGLLLAVPSWIKHFRLPYLIVFFLLALWIASVAWGSSFHSPLFIEGIAFRSAHEDQIYQSAIAEMINTYKVPTTGLDGTPFIPYHFGSQWLMAKLANTVGTTPLIFFQLGYPIVFLPLFFLSSFLLVYQVRKFLNISFQINMQFWILLSALFIGIFPVQIIGILDAVIIYSESYLISVILLFFLLSLFFYLLQKRVILPFVALLLFAPVSLAFMGLLKISTMYLLFSLYLYFFFRQKLYNLKKTFLIIFISFLSVLCINRFIASQSYANSFRFELFDFVKYNVVSFWKIFFIPYHYFYTLIYIYLRLNYLSVNTFTQLKKAFLQNKIIDLEILAILSFLGFLPGAFIHIDASGAIYFSDIQKELSIIFLVAFVPHILGKIDFSLLKKLLNPKMLLFCFFIVPLFLSFYKFNFSMPIRNFFYKLNVLKNAIVRESLNTNSKFKMVNLLQELNSIPLHEKKETLLYIPRSNKNYWNLLSCYATPLLAPALSGLAMVDGVPNANCSIVGFGYEYYERPKKTKKIESVNEICQKVIKLGFKKLKYLKTNDMKDVRSFDCEKKNAI